jgi:hypothetical protein
VLGQLGRVAAEGVGGGLGAYVGVAVDPAAAQRDRQERLAATKPHRPHRDLGNAVDQEAPARLAQAPRRGAAEHDGTDP